MKYGTQENIYEEITEERMRLMGGGHSLSSLSQSSIEEEFRRVQNRHRRVLGELNLSVEAMLMPSTPPSESPTEEEEEEVGTSSTNGACIEELLNVGPTDELLSPVSLQANGVGDVDSGFSGSSSGGASYMGSIRNRNGLTSTRSSTPSAGSGSSRSQRSNEDPGISLVTPRSSMTYGRCNKIKSAEDPGPGAITEDNKTKTSFWNRKAWRKFPGFSSTSSVHKAGIANGEFNFQYSLDDENY